MRKWCSRGKRLICFLVLAVLLIGMLPAITITTQAAAKGLTMEEMMEKFPHGKYWNGGDFYGNTWTETPCNHHGSCKVYDGSCGCNSFMGMSIQCMGFAEKLGYDATTYNPRVNANGWKKYTSVSALNNLKPGDIVRMDSASGFGHSIYVTGVDGEIVTYADCNSYNRSCNIRWGATTTKSDLRGIFQWVQSAPFPLNAGYLASCEKLPSNGTVTVINDSILRTLPCTQETEDESVEVYNQPMGSKVTVTALYRNSDGAYWYKTSYNGEVCYLFAGDTDDFRSAENQITISGVRAPINTRKGSSYNIKGKVESNPLSLSGVGAYIYTGTDISATPYMTSLSGNISTQSYEISGSVVDNNMKFGKIALGDYTYLIKATTINYSADENELASEEKTVRLHQSTFSVTSTLPCTHNYTSQVMSEPLCSDDGITLYTCTKCQFTYQEYAFGEDGHITGPWQTVKEPGCEETGKEQRYCETCKKTYTRDLPAKGHSYTSAVTAPTCTAAGYTIFTCSACGDSYTGEEVKELGHSYKSAVTPPTATEQGYTTHTCTRCGDSYADSYTAPVAQSPGVLYSVSAMVYESTENVVMQSLSQTEDRGYMPGAELVFDEFGAVTDLSDCMFQLYVTEEDENHILFMIRDSYGRYVYASEGSDMLHISAKLPESGYLWKAEMANQERQVRITNLTAEAILGYDAAQGRFELHNDQNHRDLLAFVIFEELSGDMNDDGNVDNQDVEYLLWHTLFPEDYPLSVFADYNGDDIVDNQDVEYLLWHTLFPEDYPLQ